jgi:aminoglycoside 3-N-acetyltransferase
VRVLQAQQRYSHHAADKKIGVEELVRDLSAAGIESGRDVMVHSALSQLGTIDGGAKSVIAALREVVGHGTLLMPAYPLVTTMFDWMSTDESFGVASRPSRMGALTEAFRRTPGTVRSAHPSHSVVALGSNARDYALQHHKVGTPCGPGSPFTLLQSRNGLVVCLGSSIGRVTQYHVIEDEVESLPVNVYLAASMSKSVIFDDGHEEVVSTRVHDPRLGPWRIDHFSPKEVEFAEHMEKNGVMRTVKVGMANVAIIDTVKLHKLMLNLLRKGITIYHSPKFLRL